MDKPVRMVNHNKRRAVACVLLAVTALVVAISYDQERFEIAKHILEEVPLTDGFLAHRRTRNAVELIDFIRRLVDKYPYHLQLTTSVED